MANNEYINKVEYGDQTLMDITDTTAESGDVIEGQVFYAKNGARSVGTLGDATTSVHGLMSAADKSKLDGITSGAAVTDVQINNTSILSSGIANIPPATASTLGLVQVDATCGIAYTQVVENNQLVQTYKLCIVPAMSSEIKAGTNTLKPIAVDKFHRGVFFGLAKAAGDTTQRVSTNSIGTYTEEAKSAIQSMLGVPSISDISNFYTKPSNGIPASDLASGVLPDMSLYATKANPVFTNSISLGRKSGTTTGNNSIAFGNNVEASGMFSYAEGGETVATAAGAHASGGRTVASGIYAHTCGYKTIANGGSQYVIGQYNFTDTLLSYWTADTHYSIGDKMKLYSTAGDRGYICIQENTDSTFDNSKWQTTLQTSNNVFIVGNGLADDSRSNAYALTWDGDGHYAGDVYVGCNADSTGGTKVATIEDVEALEVEVIRL